MWHYLTKIEKVSTSSLKCEYIFSYGQRRNISFLKTAYWYGLNFLYLLKEFLLPFHYYLKIFYTFWNLKIPDNLDAITFLREKVSTFPESRWYMYTLWLLITLCNMPEGLVTYLQGKQQLCIHMLYESLVGQCSFFFFFNFFFRTNPFIFYKARCFGRRLQSIFRLFINLINYETIQLYPRWNMNNRMLSEKKKAKETDQCYVITRHNAVVTLQLFSILWKF